MGVSPDVIVVGGGLWGLTTAWHLARVHGLRVEVLERREAPGLETSAQAAGHLGQVRDHALARHAAQVALDFAAALARRTDREVFVRCGSVAVVEGELGAAAIRRRFVEASAAGVGVELITQDDVVALVPGFRGRTAAAYYVPGDGYVRPGPYLTALIADARCAGVTITHDLPVEALSYEGGRVAGVVTARGPRAAGDVVLTAGPWTGTLAPGRWPAWPIALGLGRTVPAGVPDEHPIVRFPETGLYVRPEAGGYLFGAFSRTARAAAAPGLAPTTRTDDLEPDYRLLDAARERLRHLLPAVGRWPVEHFRDGWTSVTPDGLPLAGRPASLGGAWIATGCGAMGYVWAAELGRRLAAAVAAGRVTGELAPFDPLRFGDCAGDDAWIREACRQRFADYYGLDDFVECPGRPPGPSVEHFAWK